VPQFITCCSNLHLSFPVSCSFLEDPFAIETLGVPQLFEIRFVSSLAEGAGQSLVECKLPSSCASKRIFELALAPLALNAGLIPSHTEPSALYSLEGFSPGTFTLGVDQFLAFFFHVLKQL